MKSYAINEEQRQQLLNHLANKPYVEVFKIIELIAQLPEVVAAPAPAAPTEAASDAPKAN